MRYLLSWKIGQAERTPAPDRADGTLQTGAADEAALQGAGRDGGTERVLLELAVDAVLAVLEAAAFGEDAVNVLLRIAAP